MSNLTDHDKNKSWRDNWFIVNWAMAILLVRSFFRPTLVEALDTFLDDASMLAMGILFMQLNILDMHMDDELGTKIAKSFGTMVLGMTAGMAAYNTSKSLTVTAYQHFFANKDNARDDEDERVPLKDIGDETQYYTIV